MPTIPPIPMLPNEIARRRASDAPGPARGPALEIRLEPLRLRWRFEGLVAADQNSLACSFSCSVRALPEPAEQQMLAEMLMGGRRAVTDADVIAYFTPTLRQAAGSAAPVKGAEAWLAPGGEAPMVAEMKKAAQAAAFACGLDALGPFTVELDSPTYAELRNRSMQRALADREAEGQVEQFARAAELLRKFESIRGETPGITAGAVLEQVNPADRGSMLQTLLLAGAEQAPVDLWAVAGPYLVKVERGEARIGVAPGSTPRASLIPLPPTLGPLRSVSPATIAGRRALLVGARSGVLLVRPEDPAAAEAYADPAINSALGFSRAVFDARSDGSIVACHGEGGIVRWTLGKPSAPASAYWPEPAAAARDLAPPIASTGGSIETVEARRAGPRNLQIAPDGRLVFSVGSGVWILDAGELREALPAHDAGVVAIVPEANRFQVVYDDGTIRPLDRSTWRFAEGQSQGARLRAAGKLPWVGGTRLLTAGNEGPVLCLGTDDSTVMQYASHHRGLRVLAGSRGIVAAVSADRGRLVLWNSWDGRQPAAELYLTALTRHRIADAEFG